MKKKYTKTTSCLYMLMCLLENKEYTKQYFMNTLNITELDYFRYKSDVMNMLYEFGYYEIIERIKKK